MFNKFAAVELNDQMKKIAIDHAYKREEKIVRQFLPGRHAPSSEIESNYYGCIAELALRKFLNLDINLDDDYDQGQTDDGDLIYKDLKYDVKCTARKSTFYQKLYNGEIKPYESYGMIDYTSKHLHHLHKYTGGIIFTTFEVPDNASSTKINGKIREIILSNNTLLILGYLKQNEIKYNNNGEKRTPTWRGPTNPNTGFQTKYRSPNFIFNPYTELRNIKELI